jgi:hypothetical protein
VTTPPPTADEAPSPPNPFDRTTPAIQDCWRLGYHDGMHEIDPAVGESALEAFALAARDRNTAEEAALIAKLKADLETAEALAAQARADRVAAEGAVLPSVGRHSVGRSAWAFAWFYIALAVLAAAAEFPLSAITVSESIGGIPNGVIVFTKTWATPAIVVMACLIGFSIKMLFDVIDVRLSLRGAIKVGVTLVTMYFCMDSVWAVARLRGAVTQQQIAVAQVGLADTAPDSTRRQLETRVVQAREVVSTNAASTFELLTIAFPFFAATGLIIGIDQLREYRKHDRSVAALAGLIQAAAEASEQETKLRYELATEEERIARAAASEVGAETLHERAVKAYHHGLGSGRSALATRLLALGIYGRLTRDINRRLPAFLRIAPDA